MEQPTRARDDAVVLAPDGIAVYPIPLPGLTELTLAEGRLPPGEFGAHFHRSLEQVTYVLAGRLIATMGDPATGATTEIACGPGDAVSTPPVVTLSFRNPGPDEARVLFICAPPYPADNVDTATVEAHRPLSPVEVRAALDRQQTTRADLDQRCGVRLAALTALLALVNDAHAAPSQQA